MTILQKEMIHINEFQKESAKFCNHLQWVSLNGKVNKKN